MLIKWCDLNNTGLRFDPVKNDCKVVACYMSLALRYAIVYSSNSDSWTDVFVPDYVFRPDRSSWTDVLVPDCVFLNFTPI